MATRNQCNPSSRHDVTLCTKMTFKEILSIFRDAMPVHAEGQGLATQIMTCTKSVDSKGSDQTARFNAARMVQTAFYQFHTEKGLFVFLLTRIKIKSRLHIAIVQFDAAKK